MIPVEPTAEYPVPFDLSDEQPKTHADSVATAINTADLIEQLGGDIHYDNNDLHKAANLIKGTNKPNLPKHITKTAEAAAAHALIREFDFQAFADAMQARNFITNKLVSIANCGDPKTEIKALELLGKHSDIGLFTERSEITINHTTSSALENSIKERVKRLLNADITDVTPNLIDELDGIDKRKEEKTPEEALQEVIEAEEEPQEEEKGE